MDSLENPEEILSAEVGTEIPEPDFQGQEEIMDLIFPADRTISVDVYAYISRLTGRPEISAVLNHMAPELVAAGLEEYEIRSSWTVPVASQMDGYRQECSEYQPQSGSIMVNNLAIRDLIVTNHLKELLFPPEYKPFPFKYARPNRLSGDTVKKVKSMHSGVYDILYTKFISESCLVV